MAKVPEKSSNYFFKIVTTLVFKTKTYVGSAQATIMHRVSTYRFALSL